MVQDLGIPAGKKCYIVKIPPLISSSLELQKQFIAGLFDTDGGIRGHSIGFTSASENLIKDVSNFLTNIQIIHKIDSWENKKYKRRYYGLKISIKDKDKFLKQMPLRNISKLNSLLTRTCRSGQTGQTYLVQA